MRRALCENLELQEIGSLAANELSHTATKVYLRPKKMVIFLCDIISQDSTGAKMLLHLYTLLKAPTKLPLIFAQDILRIFDRRGWPSTALPTPPERLIL